MAPSDQNPPSTPPSAPKLIIDSDWKSQAQAEKEKLAAKEAERKAAAPAGAAAGGSASTGAAAAGGAGHPGMQELPNADWRALLGTMVSQALMYMGAYADPNTGRPVVDLEVSKFHIDLLNVLAEKVKGNLTDQEQTDLTQVLSELRMRYVELSQAVAKMYAAQMAKGGMPGGPGGNPMA